MKRLILIGLLSIGLVFCSFTPVNKVEYRVKTVVIDAGHGGKDSGCLSSGIMEKDIVLSISLKLGKIIKEHLNDVQVTYTRKQDKFIELYERAAIANRHSADVFLSLHCNAANTTYVKGTETYVMGLHKSEKNLEVAKRENSVVLLEEDYEENYGGFDPTSPEGHIIFSLYQNVNLEQSLELASKIEHQFDDRAKRHSRGVKQAGFLVLWKSTMPSVLVETGFLTNPHERKFLTSGPGQDYIASAIFRAFRKYKNDLESTSQ